MGPIGRPVPGGAGAGVITAGLKDFYTQQLDWQSCLPFNDNPVLDDAFAAPGLECANLIVPLDYADPSGPTVTTAVLRAPATGTRREGTLQVNPGGPGASGISYVAGMAGEEAAARLRERFDLVGFDTRGVGASRPAVDCRTDTEKDAARAANLRTTTPAGIAAIDAATTAYVTGCMTRTGRGVGIDGARFLVSLSSQTTVKDMDVLRSVLGDAELDYLGYSYGTFLGTLYAEQFGGNIRAMVLDAAVDPAADPDQAAIATYQGFQGAFEAFAVWCAGQRSCPLGSGADAATTSFQDLVRPLPATPLPLPDGRVLTYDDALTGTIAALYQDAYWPTLRTALINLADGDGFLLMALADSYDERDTDGHYSNLLDVLTAVTCMDDRRTDPTADRTALQRQIAAAAPFAASGDPVATLAGACDSWPGESTWDGTVTVPPELPPVVVVSTTGDPATPYANGVALADELRADLITVRGDRHGAYLSAGISCVDDAVTDYLTDLDMPDKGLSCP